MILVKAISGSRLHGTHNKDSDYDYRGVYLAPVNQIIGYEKRQETKQEEGDYTLWELAFFVRQCMQGTSNAIDLLFTPVSFWIEYNPAWIHLTSLKFYFISQLYVKEALRHKKAAERELQVILSGAEISDNKLKHIYKNAAHVARLLTQAKSLVEYRYYDPSELTKKELILEIKNGILTPELIITLLNMLEQDIGDYSKLPEEPNKEAIIRLVYQITGQYIRERK